MKFCFGCFYKHIYSPSLASSLKIEKEIKFYCGPYTLLILTMCTQDSEEKFTFTTYLVTWWIFYLTTTYMWYVQYKHKWIKNSWGASPMWHRQIIIKPGYSHCSYKVWLPLCHEKVKSLITSVIWLHEHPENIILCSLILITDTPRVLALKNVWILKCVNLSRRREWCHHIQKQYTLEWESVYEYGAVRHKQQNYSTWYSTIQ